MYLEYGCALVLESVHVLAAWQLHGPPPTTPERGSAEHGSENEAKLGTAAISCGREAEPFFHRDNVWSLAVVIRQVCTQGNCPVGPCSVDSSHAEPTNQIETLHMDGTSHAG